jgi:hypothetical protein
MGRMRYPETVLYKSNGSPLTHVPSRIVQVFPLEKRS